MGRIDFQVKLRGLRIELGEIEAVAEKWMGVRMAVAQLREDTPGKKVLACYLSPEGIDLPGFKTYMSANLPSYMLPQVYVLLPEVPLNQNGKVDRKSLPPPNDVITRVLVPPSTQLEEQLVQIWAIVLQVECSDIGTNSHFFELGGHSLLAIQVSNRIETAFGVKVPISALFQQLTIESLAHYLSTRCGVASAQQTGDHAYNLIPCLPRQYKQYGDGETGLYSTTRASFAQERMWALHHLDRGGLYHSYKLCNLGASVDIPRLQKCLEQLVQRHEALRTTFQLAGKELQQRVRSTAFEVPFTVIDISSLSEDVRTGELKHILTECALKPFDITGGSIFRCVLFRSANEYWLLLCMHHIITDGWSVDILERDLKALYKGRELPPLRIQYADFAAWQRHWLQGDVLEQQAKFWQEILSGDIPILQLPTDRPRPPVITNKGATISFEVPEEVTLGIRKLAANAGVSLFSCLISCYCVLLHKFSSQDDIIVGIPVTNRNSQDLEQVVGFFVNTLPLRVDLSDDPTFTSFVERVHALLLTMYSNRDIPFEEIVKRLQVPRSSGVSSVFQAMFNLQQRSSGEGAFEPVETEADMIILQASKFDLTLEMVEHREHILTFSMEYNTDIFNESSIARMGHGFNMLLRATSDCATTQLSQQTVFESPETRAKWVQDWCRSSDNPIPVPSKCAHKIFEDQVRRSPKDAALTFDGGRSTMSYKLLDTTANYLAQQLAASIEATRTKSEDIIIGLCAEQSSWAMIAGMLAVWKIGAAYVPLDPKLPKERIKHMMDDSQVEAVLCQPGAESCLPLSKLTVPVVYAERPPIGYDGPTQFPDTSITSLAYILYTSGSTGVPKGVAVEHLSLVNFASQCAKQLGHHKKTRALQLYPFAFDGHLLDILPVFLAGGTLFLKPEEVIVGQDLANFIVEQKITSVISTSSRLATIESFEMPDLEVIGSGGEAISLRLGKSLASKYVLWLGIVIPLEMEITSFSSKLELFFLLTVYLVGFHYC